MLKVNSLNETFSAKIEILKNTKIGMITIFKDGNIYGFFVGKFNTALSAAAKNNGSCSVEIWNGKKRYDLHWKDKKTKFTIRVRNLENIFAGGVLAGLSRESFQLYKNKISLDQMENHIREKDMSFDFKNAIIFELEEIQKKINGLDNMFLQDCQNL